MTKTIRESFTESGMPALFRGMPATILPLSKSVLEDLDAADAAKVGTSLQAGSLLVSWNEDGKNRGLTLRPFAGNDIVLTIRKTDDTEARVPASDLKSAALSLIKMERADEREREAVVESNLKARADHDAALARGETPEAPVDRLPTYADGAFSKVANLVVAVREAIASTIEDPFVDITEKSKAFAAQHEFGRAATNVLTPAEMAKVADKIQMQEAIGAILPSHALARPPAGAPYAGEEAGDASRELIDSLAVRGSGFNGAQMAALAANLVITEEVFNVLTSTPARAINAAQLSRGEYEMVLQDLSRHEEKAWAPQAIGRISEVLTDRMPGYRFDARLFSKDDADVLLVRDHAGAFLYSWDSASRLAEVNVRDRVLSTFTRDDVPTDAELHAMRVTLQELRYDNGGDIDFGWDDDNVLDDETDDNDDVTGGMLAGPRPDGH